ncbi:hypothetical protein Sipo8835_15535 [Streptomyces ipomoeae]|jgi:hypothetical protein|uniref:DUF8175 domain-containing protein n=2 Tax=Streptomyces ipomoeae TaxID=103232 RepID=L1L1M3_9ACTN|nr:hypothetical protein [Streptomyces ipomoeae]EKX66699.1 hypothetical protein STRIP9103_05932 [Streptomyces ipomoeae 91-03]MDX2698446.1 hypothetical protein [Streptomyces ipomoeae]MDX2823295.1 hypothetical protein [Streptomyces ipomoeae]MDX2844043.1 hypothetical protein [Streptomyces ipomoeae]MDX2878320.1 hypothetical protein [Streptomyces ipomoeae]
MLNSGRSRGGSGEWEKPFWQQRGWILSAGFLLVLLFMGAVALVVGGGDSQTEANGGSSPAPSPTTTQAGGGAADTRPAGCHTDDSQQDKPTEAPKDFRWKANGTTLVPVSKTAGPLKYDGPIWYCYAHTPMGAVMAVHSITDHLGYAGWREVVERQVVPGEGRDALIASRSQEKDRSPSGKAEASGYAGFSVLAYNKDWATVMFLIRGPSAGVYGTASVNVRWHDGDWKLDPEPDGTIYSGMAQVSGTTGFVTWET